ncbi:acyl carrier protein [Sedimenticola thiotaurini]|uniref:Acyl carrier protein n=1 Tax=Sedimenticola thiotaurini TaxID=1543721 RepID=A0A0F7JVV1_9GAMM|nr:phosphopantetheine-binding protein [Sedimenticola thiotaurini]AKH19702.1 acyl carrier protein [Sedimenticola thiotaurini]
MVAIEDIKEIIGSVLQIGDSIDSFDSATQLLGSVPEFDSMAVVSLITAIEDNYGIVVDDDEVSAEIFETVGSLHQFVAEKVSS